MVCSCKYNEIEIESNIVEVRVVSNAETGREYRITADSLEDIKQFDFGSPEIEDNVRIAIIIKYSNGEEKAIAATRSGITLDEDSVKKETEIFYQGQGLPIGTIKYNDQGKYVGYNGSIYSGTVEG